MTQSICSPGSIPKAKSLTSVACTALSKNELTSSAGPLPSRLINRRSFPSNERMSSRKHSNIPAVIITFDVTSSIPAHQSNGASVGRSQYPRRLSPFQGINGSKSTGSSSASVGARESPLVKLQLHASASLVAGSKEVPLINVSRYRRIMVGVSESRALFSRNEAAVVAKDVQGENSKTPANGEGRRFLSVGECGVDIDGCGCKKCERVDMQSPAPQESPARMQDEGGI